MGRYYLDTSALVKIYHLESGTADVQSLLQDAGSEPVKKSRDEAPAG